MRKKIFAALTAAVLLISVSSASGAGLFGELARNEDEDERLAILEEVSEQVSAEVTTENGIPVRIEQGYYEGNRVFISYSIGANTDLIQLHEGAPEAGIEWEQVLENWIPGELPSYYPDIKKENEWLDGKGQRWLEFPTCSVLDGIDLADGDYADIIAGNETRREDGSVIGWKECVVPAGKAEETVTFLLGVSCSTAIKFQDYTTFRENFGQGNRIRIPFTLTRNDSYRMLQGTSPAKDYSATAEMMMGKVDITGTIRLISPEQAAEWTAWQEGEESDGTDLILGWNLYKDGEMVSGDLYGASYVGEEDAVIFEVMFPYMDELSGLTIVPEYAKSGEHPDEAIPLAEIPVLET